MGSDSNYVGLGFRGLGFRVGGSWAVIVITWV